MPIKSDDAETDNEADDIAIIDGWAAAAATAEDEAAAAEAVSVPPLSSLIMVLFAPFSSVFSLSLLLFSHYLICFTIFDLFHNFSPLEKREFSFWVNKVDVSPYS